MQAMHLLPSLLIAVGFSIAAANAADAPATQVSPATPTTAQPASGAQMPTGARRTAQKPDDTLICKKSDPPVGSRIGGRKVCRTVAQWRALQEASREYVEEVQGRARTANEMH